MSSPFLRHLPRLHRGQFQRLLPFMLALLLVAQTLALVHRTVHARGVAPTVASASEHGLLADHTSTECRLLDQFAPTDLATVATPVLGFAAPAQSPAPEPQATAPSVPKRAFRARDPPTSLA